MPTATGASTRTRSSKPRAEAKRKALTRQLLGAVAVVGGVLAGQEAEQQRRHPRRRRPRCIGGIYAFKSGLDMRSEIKMHGESLKQLGSSFQNEVQPIVVDIEGRTLELKGSAEQQYAEWRQLLRELYENETGLPATTAAADAPPAPASRPEGTRTMTFELADGQVIAARYELLRPLRSGGQDEILEPWLARDRVSGNEVVLKRIGPAGTCGRKSRCSSRSSLWRIRHCCCHCSASTKARQALRRVRIPAGR